MPEASGPVYVALDLETTGTNPQNDRIVEIGAVKFTREGVLDTYQALVNPGRALPYRVQVLTGISDAELAAAPRIEIVAADIEGFAGDHPIVGQSIQFDLSFLKYAGVHLPGLPYDTFEIASLFLPEARDYGLKGLASFFEIPLPVHHRALSDAEAARAIFLALRDRLEQLPAGLLHEVLRLSSEVDWPLARLLEELVGGPQALIPLEAQALDGYTAPAADEAPDIAPVDRRTPIAPSEAGRYLRTAGREGAIEDFEDRPQQLEMAEAVSRALSDGHHLAVEAGTGTGKSLAYLTPAVLHSMRNGEKVVISTDTIGLQEQLIGKDIPTVRKVLADAPAIADLRATTLKGRRNYLCLLRWSQARRRPAADLYELAMLIRLLIWAPRTQTGDRAELNISQPEDQAWDRLSAQNENCLAGPCQYVKQGTCFLLRARKRAESAHLLVVNHALLLSDLAAEGGVLPSYGYLVVDEAHNLEEEATRSFGFEASRTGIEDLLTSIAGRKSAGLTGLVRALTRTSSGTDGATELLDELDVLVAQADSAAESFFQGLKDLIDEGGAEGDGERQLSLTSGTRAQPSWSRVEVLWDNLAAPLYQIEERLLKLFAALLQGGPARGPEVEAVVMQVDAAASQIHDLADGLNAIISRHDPEQIAWLSITRRGDISVSSAPLSVSTILGQQLFDQKQSVVLTSATLTAAGSFDYLKQRVGLESGEELLLDSPFDFKKAVQLLLPTDFPEPHEPGYQAACEEAISEVAEASDGRTLALFTSHSALRATYHSIRSGLEEKGIQVLAQSLDGTARQLITALKESHRTLLLGTASFWEGVDIAGEALSTLMIARLPFPVPVDPIFAARSELYDDPFNQFALPQAILRFKQGFGRLIRHRDDRGSVVVLDRRLLSKSYGEAFLNSLPDCSMSRLPRRDLAESVGRWLAAGSNAELAAAPS